MVDAVPQFRVWKRGLPTLYPSFGESRYDRARNHRRRRLEIHKPKAWHGWREFLKEVGGVVLGVLIALGAEQAVDALHWRHKVEQAEGAMRLELTEDDGTEAYVRLAIAPCLDQTLQRLDQGARPGADAAMLNRVAIDYKPVFRIYDSEAWKAAVASDVGTHMGSGRMVSWSAPYRLTPLLTQLAMQEAEYATDLQFGQPALGKLSASDAAKFRGIVGQLERVEGVEAGAARLLLARAEALGASLPADSRARLIADSRRAFGACVRAPVLSVHSGLNSVNTPAQDRKFGLGLR
jgi:hypothetical protein